MQCPEQTTLRRPPRTDKKEKQTRNKSRRNTGNGARADRRRTEIEKEPFAKQKQKAEKLEDTKARNKACQKVTVKIQIATEDARVQVRNTKTKSK